MGQRLDRPNDARREAVFVIAVHALPALLMAGRVTQVLEGLPGDAKVVGAHIDSARYMIFLTIESAEFPLVPVGSVLPVRAIILRNIACLEDLEPETLRQWRARG